MITTTKRIDDTLLAKLAAAGCNVWFSDGVLHSTDDGLAQTLIDAYSLDEAKRDVCNRILARAKAMRDAAVADVSAGEMAAWPIKRGEALAYAASNDPADAPMLSAEAAVRGITLPEMMEKVDSNAMLFAGLEIAIAGADGKHRDAVMGLETFEEVYAYDFSVGWPG